MQGEEYFRFLDAYLEPVGFNAAQASDASASGVIYKGSLKGPATLFIPGHGRSGGREVPEAALRFLEQLRAADGPYKGQCDQGPGFHFIPSGLRLLHFVGAQFSDPVRQKLNRL